MSRATLAQALMQLAQEQDWERFDGDLAAVALAAMLDGLYQIRNGNTQSRIGILLISIAFITWLVMRVAISRRELEVTAPSN